MDRASRADRLRAVMIQRWLLKEFMRIMPGPVIEWLINRGTERIRKAAANAISLKDYSSFLRSKDAPL